MADSHPNFRIFIKNPHILIKVPHVSTRTGTFASYAKEIEQGRLPDRPHSYHMKAGEFERLQGLL